MFLLEELVDHEGRESRGTWNNRYR